jgi:hypothetical protein
VKLSGIVPRKSAHLVADYYCIRLTAGTAAFQFSGFNELGEFESGLAAQWFGAAPAVVLGGIGAIVVTVLWAWMFPDLRRADSLSRAGSAGVASPAQPSQRFG